MFKMHFHVCFLLLAIFAGVICGQNEIDRNHFNFGHQSGYIYARFDSAAIGEGGRVSVATSLLHTPTMPGVSNPDYQTRTILLVPLEISYSVARRVRLYGKITDLFIEWPYESIDNTGGKSPFFKASFALRKPKENQQLFLSASVGVKFSSAKPYTIWKKKHSYATSNGLAGAGTGVADYLLEILAHYRLSRSIELHTRIGLAPLGSPVEYTRGSAQADQILYTVAVQQALRPDVFWRIESIGMLGALRYLKYTDYHVLRFVAGLSQRHYSLQSELQYGLSSETDRYGVTLRLIRTISPRKDR